MNKYIKLRIYNFLTVEDLMLKVSCFNTEVRKLVNENCWETIMINGNSMRTLKIIRDKFTNPS